MKKSELVMVGKGMIDLMNELLDKLEKFRKDEIDLRIKYERGKEELQRLTRKEIIQSAGRPEIVGAVDPRTGKSNEEWRNLIMAEEVEKVPEVITLSAQIYQWQEALAERQNDAAMIADRIGVAKAQARLLTAILEHMAEDAG